MAAKEVRNEQIKLRATYLNGMAVGLFTGGVLAPTIALALAPPEANLQHGLAFFITIVCFVLSVIVHYQAGRTLEEFDT